MSETVYALPLGAVVEYTAPDNGGAHDTFDRARLVIVEHSQDCGGEPLYMAASRPIAPPPERYKLYSMGYLVYRLHAGWYVGNCSLSCFKDTGERVKVERFDVERYEPPPVSTPAGKQE